MTLGYDSAGKNIGLKNRVSRSGSCHVSQIRVKPPHRMSPFTMAPQGAVHILLGATAIDRRWRRK